MAPNNTDPVLGYSYLSVSGFKTRASVFGCGGAAIATYTDPELGGFLAAASRLIEAYTNRDFLPNPQTEIQQVDLTTRRIRVNKPPVSSIASMTLDIYPTPTAIDVSQVLVNNQQNYIEIPFGQLQINQPPGAVEYPNVTITYNTSEEMPPDEVINAVGFTAANLINIDFTNRRITPGLNEISTEDQSITRQPFNPDMTAIPEAAKQALKVGTVTVPRVVPRGYPSRTMRGLPQYQYPYRGW